MFVHDIFEDQYVRFVAPPGLPLGRHDVVHGFLAASETADRPWFPVVPHEHVSHENILDLFYGPVVHENRRVQRMALARTCAMEDQQTAPVTPFFGRFGREYSGNFANDDLVRAELVVPGAAHKVTFSHVLHERFDPAFELLFEASGVHGVDAATQVLGAQRRGRFRNVGFGNHEIFIEKFVRRDPAVLVHVGLVPVDVSKVVPSRTVADAVAETAHRAASRGGSADGTDGRPASRVAAETAPETAAAP